MVKPGLQGHPHSPTCPAFNETLQVNQTSFTLSTRAILDFLSLKLHRPQQQHNSKLRGRAGVQMYIPEIHDNRGRVVDTSTFKIHVEEAAK